MTHQIQRRTIVFIVRLWGEYLNESPPCWRGVVEGCEPGELTPFATINDLTKLIQQKALSQNKSGNKPGTNEENEI